MNDDLMEYEQMVQEALRDVVRAALQRVERDGKLPGSHHFYIAFRTDHPDTIVSDVIAKRYPQEMTIVIQHQFWDLKVGEDAFEITLSFNNVSEHLVVPYLAIKNFFDPSVRFGLQFNTPGLEEIKPDRTLESPISDIPSAAPAETMDVEDGEEEADNAPKKTGEVVSLDQFRKK